MKVHSKPPCGSESVLDMPPSVVFGSSTAVSLLVGSEAVVREASASGGLRVVRPGPERPTSHALPGHMTGVSFEDVSAKRDMERIARAREAELVVFLKRLPSVDERVSDQAANAGIALWNRLRERFGDLVPEPMAFGTEDGGVQFAWRTIRGIVSVDVGGDGKCEWFGRRRGAPLSCFQDHYCHIHDAAPDWFMKELNRLTHG